MGRMSQIMSSNKATSPPEANRPSAAPGRRRANPPPPPANPQGPPEKPRVSPPRYQPQQSVTPSYAAVAQGVKMENPQSASRREPCQYPPAGFAVGPIIAPNMNHFPQQQQPFMGHMPVQHRPENGYFHQEPPQHIFQMQQLPQMGYMPQGMIVAVPGQFMQAPMYNAGPNAFPYKTVPPPGFEPRVAAYTGQPLISQYDAFGANPSFVNCSFNQHIALDGPVYPPIPMQPFPLFIPSQKMPNKRRPKAIAIIDPATGVDKLNEIYGPKIKNQPEKELASPRQ